MDDADITRSSSSSSVEDVHTNNKHYFTKTELLKSYINSKYPYTYLPPPTFILEKTASGFLIGNVVGFFGHQLYTHPGSPVRLGVASAWSGGITAASVGLGYVCVHRCTAAIRGGKEDCVNDFASGAVVGGLSRFCGVEFVQIKNVARRLPLSVAANALVLGSVAAVIGKAVEALKTEV